MYRIQYMRLLIEAVTNDSFFSCSSSITFPYLQKAGNDRGNLLTHQEDKNYLQRLSQPPIK